MGKVELLDVFERMLEPFANDVRMWLVSVEKVWDCYLANKKRVNEETRKFYTMIEG